MSGPVRAALVVAAATVVALPAAAAPTPVGFGKQVYCGGGSLPYVALTFDDGPGPYTAALLAALRRSRAQGTFFVVASRLRSWAASARAAARVGMLGNHTWDHAHLARLKPAAVLTELRRAQYEIARRTGQWTPYFRPPYEEATRAVERAARVLGLVDVRWNVDSGDSQPGATPARTIARATRGLRPGAIVLLHDAHPWTASVAGSLVREIRRRHLRPVTLARMLTLDPPRGSCVR